MRVVLWSVLVLGVLVIFGAPPREDDGQARPLVEDDTVLARLPRRSSAPAGDPVAVAREALVRAGTESDPRWLGRAQAALAPWWHDPSPPHEVLVLRATLRQSQHEFEAALGDLREALRQDPADPQVWLTLAVVLQVRGELDEARASCRPLVRLASPLVATACSASVEGQLGLADPAAAALIRALDGATDEAPVRAWALGILGELHARLGHAPEAERRFREALALTPRDAWLLGALADLLLDTQRPAEVLALLAGETAIDSLLLRLAIAEKRLGRGGPYAVELGARHAAARARGDRTHLREEARHALEVAGDARAALALARENWTIQREPADARVLAEAERAVAEAEARR